MPLGHAERPSLLAADKCTATDVICSSSWDPNLAASLSGLKSALDGGVYIATTEDHTRSNLHHARSTQDHKVRVSVDDTLRRLQEHTANPERHGGGSPSHDGAGRRAGPHTQARVACVRSQHPHPQLPDGPKGQPEGRSTHGY